MSAQVLPGEVLSVMGPSGVGKSTLLAQISGHLAPDFSASGDVRLNGQSLLALPAHLRRVGLLFQDDLLFPHLSVGANLAFGLPRGGSRAERRARIDTALEEIGLAGFAARDPATLSSDPKALLLDEAFSALDATLRDQMRELVFSRAKASKLPVLMVTHDAADAAAAGGEIIRLG